MKVKEWLVENLKGKDMMYYKIELEVDSDLNVLKGEIIPI